MIPRLYKLAAIKLFNYKNVFDFINRSGRIGKSILRGGAIEALNGLSGAMKFAQLKRIARDLDNFTDMSNLLRKIKNLKYLKIFEARPQLLRRLLLDYILRINGLQPLRAKLGLIGGMYQRGLDHILTPLRDTNIKRIFKDLDMFLLVTSMLSAKLGRVRLLPRLQKDLQRIPSRYFGFLGDPLFNLRFYEKTKNNPEAMPISQYNANIGRIFNTRGHTFDGKLIKFDTDWTNQRGRYQNQLVIAQPLGYPYGLQLVGEGLSRFTRSLGKGLYQVPPSMHWSPLIKALLISPIHF